MDEMKRDENFAEEMKPEGVKPEQEQQKTYVEVKANTVNSEKKTLSIAALILGLVGIIFDFIYLWIGLIAGIIGIIIGVKARKEENAKGMATAGFICSIVAVAIGGFLLACALCAIGTLAAGLAAGL